MKIENNFLNYNKNYNRNIETINVSFKDYIEKIDDVKNDSLKDKFTKSKGINYSDISIYSKTEMNTSEIKFPIETERYIIELANEIEGVQAYVIKDKEWGDGLYIREDEIIIQKDAGTGMEFIINMDQPFFMNLLVTSELKSMLNDLAQKRGFELQTGSMQGDLAIYQDQKTGLQYMAIKGDEGRGASIIVSSQEDVKIIENLKNEFMKYPVIRCESIAFLFALLEISGNLRRGDEGFTYLTPDGITYIPYDGDVKKAWEIGMSNEYYAIARKSLNKNIDFENCDVWEKIFKGAKIKSGFIEIYNYNNFDTTNYNFQYKLNN